MTVRTSESTLRLSITLLRSSIECLRSIVRRRSTRCWSITLLGVCCSVGFARSRSSRAVRAAIRYTVGCFRIPDGSFGNRGTCDPCVRSPAAGPTPSPKPTLHAVDFSNARRSGDCGPGSAAAAGFISGELRGESSPVRALNSPNAASSTEWSSGGRCAGWWGCSASSWLVAGSWCPSAARAFAAARGVVRLCAGSPCVYVAGSNCNRCTPAAALPRCDESAVSGCFAMGGSPTTGPTSSSSSGPATSAPALVTTIVLRRRPRTLSWSSTSCRWMSSSDSSRDVPALPTARVSFGRNGLRPPS
mmetsp:Transcript_33594/g.103711  ORF Transcript_33594/g.103711 Transcript_33594/m.103711 type:complete len:303 (-) Transcript_33594:430-1338(-)